MNHHGPNWGLKKAQSSGLVTAIEEVECEVDDVDECTLETALPTTSPHTCHPTARCINLDGAFECACASGYRAYYGVSGYHNETVARRLEPYATHARAFSPPRVIQPVPTLLYV